MDCASRAILYRIATGAPTQIAMRHWRKSNWRKTGAMPPQRNPSPRRFHRNNHFTCMVSSFGATRPRNTAIRFVEQTQKVAAPPARAPDGSLAREAIVLSVDGAEQEVEVERQERPRGGCKAYWRCPRCDRRCCALFIVECSLACRVCHRLDYRSRHVLKNYPAVARAAKLRRRLGAERGLMGKLPPRPRHNKQAARYDRLVQALAKEEAVLARLLGDTVAALKRRKGRLHGPR